MTPEQMADTERACRELATEWKRLLDAGVNPVALAQACAAMTVESHRAYGLSDWLIPTFCQNNVAAYIALHPRREDAGE